MQAIACDTSPWNWGRRDKGFFPCLPIMILPDGVSQGKERFPLRNQGGLCSKILRDSVRKAGDGMGNKIFEKEEIDVKKKFIQKKLRYCSFA